VLAARTPDGAVWASIVAGQLPFLTTEDEGRFLRIAGIPRASDPLSAALVLDAQVGVVAIDFETRRRFRVNGRLVAAWPDALRIQVEEAFGNCPKYIQAYVPRGDARQAPGAPQTVPRLDEGQAAWIARAALFFLGTLHPVAGADASHRGGAPGFVRVLSPTELAWGDYFGNALFQSLGNATVQPRVGLLFLDPATGSTLQLTGALAIDWTPRAAAEIPGASASSGFRFPRSSGPAAVPLRWILSEPAVQSPALSLREQVRTSHCPLTADAGDALRAAGAGPKRLSRHAVEDVPASGWQYSEVGQGVAAPVDKDRLAAPAARLTVGRARG
jgi:hypothetical protein